MSFFILPAAAIVLMVCGAPKSVIKEVARLIRERSTFQAIECVLWFLSHSPLKLTQKGHRFDIGSTVGEKARKDIFNWAKVKCKDRRIKWLSLQRIALSGVCASIDREYWLKKIECNPTILQDLKGQTVKGNKRKAHNHARLQRDYAVCTFQDLLNLAETSCTTIFLVSGTFLGAVRNNDFIGHDYDIDVGVLAEDFDLKSFLEAVYESRDFYLKGIESRLDWEAGKELPGPAIPAVVKLLHRTLITVDVFVHYREKNDYEHGTGSHIWVNRQFSLANYPFLETEILGPKNYNLYLTENYGDWRKEKKSFDCDFDTPNLRWADSPYTELYLREYFYFSDIL